MRYKKHFKKTGQGASYFRFLPQYTLSLFLLILLVINIVTVLKTGYVSGDGAYPPFVVRGTVKLEDGSLVVGAKVYVENENKNLNISALTDANGRYTVGFNVTPDVGDRINVWCVWENYSGVNSTTVSRDPIANPILDINLVLKEKREKETGLETVFCYLPVWAILLVSAAAAILVLYYQRKKEKKGEQKEEKEVDRTKYRE